MSAENADHSITYDYDGDNIRARKTVDGKSTNYLTHAGQVLKEYANNGAPGNAYVPEVAWRRKNDAGDWNYYLTDGLGSVLAITDNGGNEVARYDYSDYGVLQSSDGPLAEEKQFRYTGEQFDPETGFYYLRNRYYQPEFGRFLQRDPIRYAGGSNMYAYCSGDPISKSDPSGLLPEELPGSYAERQARWAAENPQQARQQMLMVEGGIQMFPGGGWVVQAIDFAAGDWEWSPPVHGTPRAPLSGGAGGSGPSRPSQSSIEIQNGRPVLVRGNTQGPLVVRPRTTGRTQDASGIGVEVTAPDGSYLEISGARVKAGVPNTHPRAPAGTIQKVHWPNPFPTDPAKRLPTTGELDFLRETHGL